MRLEHRVLATNITGAIAQGGVDPTLEGRALQDALRRAIASRWGYCSWDVDLEGWVVTLHSPEEQDFSRKSLEQGLAWRLMWLMFPELGIRAAIETQRRLGGGSDETGPRDRNVRPALCVSSPGSARHHV